MGTRPVHRPSRPASWLSSEVGPAAGRKLNATLTEWASTRRWKLTQESRLMATPAVDVLLPVYNAAGTIDQAVESLLRQTISDIRIIIVDDGSTDATPRALTRLARQDPRITVITTANGGIVDALNAGLAQCKAEFIARQDADDISHPSRLSFQLAHLRDDAKCVAISGAVQHMDEYGRVSDQIQTFPPPDRFDFRWAPAQEPSLIHPFLMVRRADLEAVGGYRYVFHSEDMDLYWRLLERGRLRNLDTVLGYYRMHATSISGASIVNGRIISISSQLAAISARRRYDGRPDIQFYKDAISEYRTAVTLHKIYELAIKQLSHDEARYLRVATAGKLLEITAYRPYELDMNDCRFIRDARREFNILSDRNRRHINRLYSRAITRLLHKRLHSEAVELLAPALIVPTAARLIAATLLPSIAVKYIRRLRAL